MCRVNLDHILSAVANDPTLMRENVECPVCGHGEAVLIQSTQNVKSNKLTLIMVCCNEQCGHKWTDSTGE
jgi:DNA-directed RNA polymerase subunit M/transcription elongation factor TFIIS